MLIYFSVLVKHFFYGWKKDDAPIATRLFQIKMKMEIIFLLEREKITFEFSNFTNYVILYYQI